MRSILAGDLPPTILKLCEALVWGFLSFGGKKNLRHPVGLFSPFGWVTKYCKPEGFLMAITPGLLTVILFYLSVVCK